MKIKYSKTGIMSLEGITDNDDVVRLAVAINNHAEYLNKLQDQCFNNQIESMKSEDEVDRAVKTLKHYCFTHKCDGCRFEYETGKCFLPHGMRFRNKED